MANKNRNKQTGSKTNIFNMKPAAACVRIAIAGGLAAGSVGQVQAELPVPSAVWASMGNATKQVIGNHMRIDQHTDRAILNWQSFNIGKDNSVHFQQPGSTSIALNRIFQNDPSRILGTLTANGQVYLVNRNGFVFGKDARVDVRGLVASTLDISDEVFNQGVTKAFANNGTAAFQGNGDFYLKNEDGSFKLDADGNKIMAAITIEAGAQIKASDGQNILIIAPTITNGGYIESDDRQIILAAATDKVYLQEAGNDGILVEVQTGGEVNNLGTIAAKRGKVTLVGFAVNQNGKISASTSLNINGTVRLLAREKVEVIPTPDGFTMQAGSTTRANDIGDGLGTSASVTFGANSKTEILPELGDGSTAIDEQVQPLSELEVMAHKVHFKNGSEVVLPGGNVNVVATENPVNPLQESLNRNNSRILVDSGAKIDVSGIDTTVKPMESNIIEVELRLNQLKDSPLQRDGILFGKTILVDIRKGTPIADIQPDIDAIQRSLGERLAKGGEINLGSEGDAIVQNNALLDFSGGAVTYLDGYITTTKLTSKGRVFDISEAHPSLKYDGIYGEVVKVYEKWGVRKVWKVDGPFALARREAGYIEGHDAGRVTIKGPNILLEGELKGGAVSGRLQRTLDSKARGGELLIDMRSASAVTQSVIFSSAQSRIGVGLDLDDVFPTNDQNLTVALALQSDLIGRSGIQDASILTHGTVEIAGGSTVKLADGGSLNLQGGSISVNGNIKGAGADVSLTTALNAQTIGVLDGAITIGQGANIDLQGGWVNDLVTPFSSIDSMPVAIAGGRFSARANGDVVLQAGSTIDVSGGAWLKTSGETEAGEAGAVQLVAAADNVGSNITLDGLLYGYGIEKGGALELEAKAVAIRRRRDEEFDGLELQPEFFGQGGFADYRITANTGGLTVDEDAQIELRQVNRVLDGASITQANSGGIASFSTVKTLRPIQRSPSSLTLVSNHSIGPNLTSHLIFKTNASVVADPLSTVSLISDSALHFDGAIAAKGGDVTLAIVPPEGLPDPLYQAAQGIWLGDNARIDVSGTAITTVDALGRRSGEVYDGGSIKLDAARGFVATKAGSSIDVSGSAGVINLPRINQDGFGLVYDPVTIGSHGGSIAISAAEGFFLDGNMIAKGGGATGTSGGTLSVRLDGTQREEPLDEGIVMNFPTEPGILYVAQQKNSVFTDQFEQAGDMLPTGLARKGYLSANQVSNGGFATLNLQADDEIRFQGDIDINVQRAINLDAPKYGWERLTAGDTGRVVLSAAHASVGSSRTRTATGNANGGDGSLNIKADLIELYGGSYTTGFDQASFEAANDMRLRGIRIVSTQRDYVGEFKTFKNLNLTADQVYPNTLTDFTLAVTGDPNGVVTFSGGENRSVLSAYSKLTVKAPNIHQNGIVKSTFGEIVFDASDTIKFGSNSITSVSAEGRIIPFGVTEGGLEWLYPIDNQNLIVQAPNKNITFKADKIQRDTGALIDLSGGGDLLAYEFIPGIGGSVDVLSTGNSFAVIPGLSGYSPYDPFEFPSSGLTIGDSLYLGAGSGLAAGYYTKLPAHYALLPGAYLITPQAGTRDMMPGTKTVNLDGATVVAGFNATSGTTIRDQRLSGFAVEPGSIALTRSQLDLTTANRFFTQQAIDNETAVPRLPQDAGHLIFDTKTQLDLPTVRAEASNGGLAGLVDIVAENLAVVNVNNGAVNTVQLRVGDLDTFEVGSLLLGAVRSFDKTTGAVMLDVKSKTVTLAEDTTLKGPEVMLAATDKVELKEGASVVAVGNKPANDNGPVLETAGDGALLRVSTGAQAVVKRTGTQGLKGDLIVNEGALVSADTGSVLLDSTRQLTMNGELEAGNSLNIGAEAINLGEVDGSLSGLSLDNAQLSGLNTKELVLTSRSNINLFGGIYRTGADGQLMPVELEHLVFDAAGFAGFGNAGKTTAIKAETVTLRNSGNASGVSGSGTGELSLGANRLLLDGGNFTLSGFGAADFSLSGSMTGFGETRLTSLGDLNITTGYATGATGSKTSIDAAGYKLAVRTAQSSELPSVFGIAAELNLSADSIDIDAPLLFRSGIVTADAKTGDVTLGENALIDVSGIVVSAGLSAPLHVQAGRIDLTSQQRNVTALDGSRMQLNGSTSRMAAGNLNVSAAQGLAQLNGAIAAHGDSPALGGSVRIDVADLGGSGFGGLNTIFDESGFTGAIDVRLRDGDLTIAQNETVKARQIELTADNGQLTVAGMLDSSGGDGGSIGLNSNGKLTLASTAKLDASAYGANGDGGKVKLSSVEGGGIEIQDGASIDVSANGGKEGEVHLRADRSGNDVNIAPIASGTVVGDSNVIVEAVKLYNFGTINATAINTIKNETAPYMNAVAANGILGTKFGAGYEIAPGVEVRSDGNMTLSSKWDLVDWRYGPGDTPGFLTLRAAGNVTLQQDLTDAFALGIIPLADLIGMDINVYDMLQPGRSWSYDIVAGADLDSADSTAAIFDDDSNSGDINIANNVKVRTGTGDIGLHAGRDIVYGNNRSVVYTAGRPDDDNRYGFKRGLVAFNFYAEYPLDGGDINFRAGRDIKGAVTNQLATDWLVRTGDWSRNSDHSGERPTAWGVAVSDTDVFQADYRQNVGALGGGNVNISAGGNISNLSVVIPTTGKQVGESVDPHDEFNWDYKTNAVEVNGGGNLNLTASGNIAGGAYYVDGGTANIKAGGSLTAGSNQGLNPVLALGDAQYHITAAKNIALEAIVDPMSIPQGKMPDLKTLFFRYTPESAVSLTSLTGNITIENDVSAMVRMLDNLTFAIGEQNALTVYPSSLRVTALNGDLRLEGSLIMFPSVEGQLELFAGNNITTGASLNDVNIAMSDSNPVLLPSSAFPAANYIDANLRLNSSGQGEADKIFSAVPNHINDMQSALISTGSGNIAGNRPLLFVTAKPIEVMAGNDIRNVSFQIQHNFIGAESIVNAGRDLKFDIARNPLTGALTNVVQKVEVSGPGQLTVLAGRDVNLGSSDGIFSVGNQLNPALAEDGASIDVIAGLAKTNIDVAAYASRYLADGAAFVETYQQAVSDYMRRLTGDTELSREAAAEAFKKLTPAEQAHFNAHYLTLIHKPFNDLMKEQGNKFSVAKNGFDNASGDDTKFKYKQEMDLAQLEVLAAIETLFPGTTILAGNDDYSIDPAKGIVFNGGNDAGSVLSKAYGAPRNKEQTGEISMFFSKIHTTDGGDINLYAPNGGVNAGLAVNSSGAKDASQLGIVALKKGAIHSIVRDDFQVNTTRAMTLGGGDIVIGSTDDNIDTGRGAKTALAAPAPIVRFDEKGNMIVELPPAVAGSGIRANVAPDGTQGDVLLFALQGIIDASEAGVGGKDVVVGATAIVGSDNIDVGGVSIGVPTASTGSIAAGLGNVANVAAAVQQAVDNSADAGKDASDKMASAAALGIISVDIVGFGDEDVQ